MKFKIVVFLIFISIFLITACSSDSDSQKNPINIAPVNVSGVINFSGVEGEDGAAKSVILFQKSGIEFTDTLSLQANWLTIETDINFDTDITTIIAHLNVTDPQFGIKASTLKAGKHVATNEISYTHVDGSTGIIKTELIFTSIPALAAPTEIILNIDATNNVNDILEKQFTIKSNRKSGSINWTARTLYSWTTILNSTGDTSSNNNNTITLDTAATANLIHGSYPNEIQINSDDPTVSSLQIPVTLNILKPEINFVAPFYSTESTIQNVILRGYGLDTINQPTVMFGSQAASSISVISDTEVHATHPALASGSYPVTLSGSNFSAGTKADLTVVAAPGYQYFSHNNSGSFNKLPNNDIIYNPVNQTILLMSKNSIEVIKYQFDGKTWNYSVLIPSLPQGGRILWSDLALTPDGKQIYNIHGAFIHGFDSTTLIGDTNQSVTSIDVDIPSQTIAFTNDGSALLPFKVPNSSGSGFNISRTRFNIVSGYKHSIDESDSSRPLDYIDARVRTSADGSFGIFGYQVAATQAEKAVIEYYDTSNNKIVGTTVRADVDHISLARHANKFIINNDVYNSAFTLLGHLPASTEANVITADGNFAFGFEHIITPPSILAKATIRKFDLNNTDATGEFVEITSIPLTDDPGNSAVMAVSPDSGTVFISGDDKFLVQPIL